MLWIATAEGLNTFDGFTITKYYREQYPALGSNHIADILCDDENRIWLRSNNGKITLIDEKRNFIPVPVLLDGKEMAVSFICNTRSNGIITLFEKNIFTLKKKEQFYFEALPSINEISFPRAHLQQVADKSDTLIFSGNNNVMLFDAAQKKILYQMMTNKFFEIQKK